MRILKSVIAILIIILISVSAAGCTSSSTATATVTTKQVTVALGTISNAVTGTAILDLAKTQDLAFEMAGYVDQILVKVSDNVVKGQLLATLDNNTQADTIQTLRDNLQSAQEKLSTAQRTLNDKKYALTVAKRTLATTSLDVQQAELDLKTAKDTLANVDDVKQAQAAVDSINNDITLDQTNIRAAETVNDTALINQWTAVLKNNQALLITAQTRLDNVLKGSGVSSDSVALQIATDVLAVTKAQKALDDAKSSAQNTTDDNQVKVDNAQLDVTDAQQAVDDDQQSVANAKNKLSVQQALSTQIIAPFDGFITSIKTPGGTEVYKGSVAMQIADPNQFDATFMVSETDIFSLKVGQAAVVSVDALSGENFAAKVTAIAPLATVSSGVVNYQVTAEITSLVPLAITATATSASSTSGVPTGIPTGIPTGTRPISGTNNPAIKATPTASAIATGTPSKTSDNNSATGQTATTTTAVNSGEAATLKQGLSASVTITIQEKKNVLVVPIRAVTTAGGKSTVQVIENSVTKTVDVTTGLSDASNIEITSGLTAGQIVVVKTSGTASSSAFSAPVGGFLQ